MPVNRAESVKGLVSRCRESADLLCEDPLPSQVGTAKIDLQQAANEIEDLAEIVDNEEAAFKRRYRLAMSKALREFVLSETGMEAHLLFAPGHQRMDVKATVQQLTLDVAFKYERRGI